LLDGGAVLGKMDRRIEMRSCMFNDAPPKQVETIFLEIVLTLHFDARLARKGWKLGRHRVGEIDDTLKTMAPRRGLGVPRDRGCCKGRGSARAREKAAA
jgi:hypothetical protein